ncbi:MAG: hypothetical protein U0610_22640 [bacterium]
MSSKRPVVAAFVALASFLAGAATLHGRLLAHDQLHRTLPNDALYLPKPELFRATSFGFHQLAADLLWAKLVQAVGNWTDRTQGFKYTYQYADIVTDIDPGYAAPYLIANFWLVGWDRIEDANAILEKGHRRFPQSYKFPYYLGLNHFLWLHDRVRAIQYFSEAATLHETPEASRRSMASALERPDDPTAAFDLIMNLYSGAGSRQERQAIEPLVVHGMFFQLATEVNAASAKYEQTHGHKPTTLEELVEDGSLRSVPRDPYGGTLRLDEAGLLRSSVRPNYWWERKPSAR